MRKMIKAENSRKEKHSQINGFLGLKTQARTTVTSEKDSGD